MAQAAPCIRANWTKLALKFLRQRPAPERDPVLARLGDDALRKVRAAGVFDWLPAPLHLSLVEALRATRGDEEARRFWRGLMLASFDRALLKPLFEGGLRLFGRSPRGILRMTPQAYQLVTRDCGSVRTESNDGDGGILLTFSELPPPLRVPGWVEVCAGNCEAALDALGQQGTVRIGSRELADGRFTIYTVPRS